MNEIIGLTATVFIVAGFLLNGEAKIRAINIVGAVLYVIYGFLIGSMSNILLNGILVIVHIIKLSKINAVHERGEPSSDGKGYMRTGSLRTGSSASKAGQEMD